MVVASVFVVFVVQNSETVQLRFLTWTFESPRVVLIALSAVVGIVIWELLRFSRRRSRKKNA